MNQRVLELLMSRICHDLISPVGAVVNGVELIEESGADMAADAMALIAKSARLASRRLQFYRMAYGTAGAGGDRSLADARQLTLDFLADSRVMLNWPDEAAGRGERAGPGGIKLLLNLAVLGADALPRGGKLQIAVSIQADRHYVEIAAEGTNARLDSEVMVALAPEAVVESLQPRTIQAYFTARLAERLDARLTYDSAAGRVIIEALLPPTAAE
jgi:histidine phosphotransferase ChpT